MNNHPMIMEKVFPKIRKFNILTMDVYNTILKIVLAPKILKSLCRQHGVIQTLNKVLHRLLKVQGMIPMTC